MRGGRSHIPYQQDAAGGHAYVLLCAYKKFGDKRYLQHAKSATEALLSQKESRFYEALLPLGCYTAAYLNATEGKSMMCTNSLTGCLMDVRVQQDVQVGVLS